MHSCNSLIAAATLGHLDCIKTLVDAGGNINAKDASGKTPLHWVVRYGNDACVRVLVDAGAHINTTDNNGETPLHWAAWCGKDVCVRILVDAGADINTADNNGETPLHTALWYGNDACVRVLVDAGADINAKDVSGMTPLQLAVKKGHKKCAEILAVSALFTRSLSADEWDVIPEGSDIGYLLPVVMARDGRDAAAKLVSKLPAEKRKVLQTAAMCLSRFVHHDVAEQILGGCV